VSRIVRGRIVYSKIAIPDPQGVNPKEGRPFVVISRDDEIDALDHVQLVGITSELRLSPPEHLVELKWGPTAKTGLRLKSAALCTWHVQIPKAQLDVGKGFVAGTAVDEIVQKVLQFETDKLNQGTASDGDRPAWPSRQFA